MKPGLPKGTRDFLPLEVLKRKFMFSAIESIFQKYSYVPIETPTMELLSTLTGKYGDEGDRLLFKVLNNGDYLSKADHRALEAKDSNALIPSIAKRGMRYDLTVPFARYVVMHQNDIQLPFKRYQIQPVWRADRPQKGRYQEFYQCDVDVVGSSSLSYEAELVQIYDEVFAKLGMDVRIRINNRKVLAGIAESVGASDHLVPMTVAIDKLDKIGPDGVSKELEGRGFTSDQIQKILSYFQIQDLEELGSKFENSQTGKEGVGELKEVLDYLEGITLTNTFDFDITLARGLSYYTGCIFEVNALDYEIGSVGGGGRYDNLTGVFGMQGVSGVGISFGAARIFDVMEGLELFPPDIKASPKVIFLTFDKEAHKFAYKCVSQLRATGINADLYPDPVKMKKQMKYANAVGAEYVAIVGDEEVKSGQVSIKHMETGEQQKIATSDLPSYFS